MGSPMSDLCSLGQSSGVVSEGSAFLNYRQQLSQRMIDSYSSHLHILEVTAPGSLNPN